MNRIFSEKIYTCLAAKVIKFNKTNKNTVTVEKLIRVYKRGEKAAQVNWEPCKTTAQWAMARVNMFLKLVSGEKVNDSYKFHDMDIIKGTDKSYIQEDSEPFWRFSNKDFLISRSDLLLSHITDDEAEKTFFPLEVEEQ
tara:strand:- start:22716 stop:23132 length:417 start_codon:yes stop_codon:yes gene_type:complete